MASQQYKDRLWHVVEGLPDDKAAQVVTFAESLRALKQEGSLAKPFRPLGLYRGKIRIDPSFFDPLPDEILDAFEGKGE